MRVGARPAKATAGDLRALSALLEAAKSAAVTERGGRLLVEQSSLSTGKSLADQLRARLTDPDSLIGVGTIDGVVLGLVIARISRAGSGRSRAVIEALYVESAAREVGVGEELLGLATAWAGRRQASGLDVTVLPGVRETKNFFEGAGYVARSIVMHRPVRHDDG